MKAAKYYGKRDIRIEDVEMPKIKSDEALIKVKRCGICGTDLHEYVYGPQTTWFDEPNPLTGHQGPLIFGHEFSGVIEDLGEDIDHNRWHVGDRVCIMNLLHCGKCKYCRMGLEQLCENFACIGLQWPYGGLGEYVNVKEYNLRKLPDNMTFEQGACIEPLSVAMYGIRRGNMMPGDKLFISGCGPTASFTLLGAMASGATEIYMSEVKDIRRNRCKEWGATEVFDPTKVNVGEEIKKRTEWGVDIAIDCTGNQSAMNDCINSLRKRGTYVQSGLPVGDVTINMYDMAYRDYNFAGLWCYNTYDFEQNIALVEQGRIPVEKVVTRVMGVEETVDAFNILADDKEGKEVKIQISFE